MSKRPLVPASVLFRVMPGSMPEAGAPNAPVFEPQEIRPEAPWQDAFLLEEQPQPRNAEAHDTVNSPPFEGIAPYKFPATGFDRREAAPMDTPMARLSRAVQKPQPGTWRPEITLQPEPFSQISPCPGAPGTDRTKRETLPHIPSTPETTIPELGPEASQTPSAGAQEPLELQAPPPALYIAPVSKPYAEFFPPNDAVMQHAEPGAQESCQETLPGIARPVDGVPPETGRAQASEGQPPPNGGEFREIQPGSSISSHGVSPDASSTHVVLPQSEVQIVYPEPIGSGPYQEIQLEIPQPEQNLPSANCRATEAFPGSQIRIEFPQSPVAEAYNEVQLGIPLPIQGSPPVAYPVQGDPPLGEEHMVFPQPSTTDAFQNIQLEVPQPAQNLPLDAHPIFGETPQRPSEACLQAPLAETDTERRVEFTQPVQDFPPVDYRTREPPTHGELQNLFLQPVEGGPNRKPQLDLAQTVEDVPPVAYSTLGENPQNSGTDQAMLPVIPQPVEDAPPDDYYATAVLPQVEVVGACAPIPAEEPYQAMQLGIPTAVQDVAPVDDDTQRALPQGEAQTEYREPPISGAHRAVPQPVQDAPFVAYPVQEGTSPGEIQIAYPQPDVSDVDRGRPNRLSVEDPAPIFFPRLPTHHQAWTPEPSPWYDTPGENRPVLQQSALPVQQPLPITYSEIPQIEPEIPPPWPRALEAAKSEELPIFPEPTTPQEDPQTLDKGIEQLGEAEDLPAEGAPPPPPPPQGPEERLSPVATEYQAGTEPPPETATPAGMPIPTSTLAGAISQGPRQIFLPPGIPVRSPPQAEQKLRLSAIASPFPIPASAGVRLRSGFSATATSTTDDNASIAEFVALPAGQISPMKGLKVLVPAALLAARTGTRAESGAKSVSALKPEEKFYYPLRILVRAEISATKPPFSPPCKKRNFTAAASPSRVGPRQILVPPGLPIRNLPPMNPDENSGRISEPFAELLARYRQSHFSIEEMLAAKAAKNDRDALPRTGAAKHIRGSLSIE
ncbi:extensin-like [Galendromus occidentalis]|uniref:Extensin-like n=1 Tax=Galendromus occidentalis TaxID=34638 RepID=A0AAJ7L627_9ACAR|nr:extensin-like [Galendromus occidentalis]